MKLSLLEQINNINSVVNTLRKITGEEFDHTNFYDRNFTPFIDINAKKTYISISYDSEIKLKKVNKNGSYDISYARDRYPFLLTNKNHESSIFFFYNYFLDILSINIDTIKTTKDEGDINIFEIDDDIYCDIIKKLKFKYDKKLYKKIYSYKGIASITKIELDTGYTVNIDDTNFEIYNITDKKGITIQIPFIKSVKRMDNLLFFEDKRFNDKIYVLVSNNDDILTEIEMSLTI